MSAEEKTDFCQLIFGIANKMAENQCVGIKQDGERCGSRIGRQHREFHRCGTHLKTLLRSGLMNCEITELQSKQMRELRNHNRNINPEERIGERHARELEELRARFQTPEFQEQNRRVEETRVPFLTQEEETRRQREARWEQVRAEREARWAVEDRANQQRRAADEADHEGFLARIRAVIAGDNARPNRGVLGNFAHDRQNVHTTLQVRHMNEMITKIRAIPIPEEYEKDHLKTTGEIILECNLSKRSAWQMMAKQCQDETIYDMEPGIYGIVLRHVWQYIKNSPNRNDLTKVLAMEMEDNVGMCTQGNLSRLVNILTGYLDGLDIDTRSRNEILGDKMSELMRTIADATQREQMAIQFLKDQKVPEEEIPIWVEPLLE